MLQLGAVDETELYRALDWLGARQAAIETALARRHLKDGALVLYDVSSSWLEGRCCELARFGYSRDGKKGKLQIVYGLLCAADGCPVAVEVFEGNTADPGPNGSSVPPSSTARGSAVARPSTSRPTPAGKGRPRSAASSTSPWAITLDAWSQTSGLCPGRGQAKAIGLVPRLYGQASPP